MAPQSHPNVLQLIGQTPLIAVTHLETGPCRLFLKLENQNPGGSIKDRVGLYLIEAAERDGRLNPGGTLIEATAGNTGLGRLTWEGYVSHAGPVVIIGMMSIGIAGYVSTLVVDIVEKKMMPWRSIK